MYLFAYETLLALSNFFVYYVIFLFIVLRIELEALCTPGKHHGVFIKCRPAVCCSAQCFLLRLHSECVTSNF